MYMRSVRHCAEDRGVLAKLVQGAEGMSPAVMESQLVAELKAVAHAQLEQVTLPG